MIFACVGLHNFLRLEDSNDDFDTSNLLPEPSCNVTSTNAGSNEDDDLQSQLQQANAGIWRDSMTQNMRNDGTHLSRELVSIILVIEQ